MALNISWYNNTLLLCGVETRTTTFINSTTKRIETFVNNWQLRSLLSPLAWNTQCSLETHKPNASESETLEMDWVQSLQPRGQCHTTNLNLVRTEEKERTAKHLGPSDATRPRNKCQGNGLQLWADGETGSGLGNSSVILLPIHQEEWWHGLTELSGSQTAGVF